MFAAVLNGIMKGSVLDSWDSSRGIGGARGKVRERDTAKYGRRRYPRG